MRIIVEPVDPRSIKHLFLTQTRQSSDGLAYAWNILDVHHVKVDLSSQVLQPRWSPSAQAESHGSKEKLAKVIDYLGLGLL